MIHPAISSSTVQLKPLLYTSKTAFVYNTKFLFKQVAHIERLKRQFNRFF